MKAHQDAAVAALLAAWPSGRVYAVGAVPASPVTPYIVLGVDGGLPGNYSLASEHGSKSYRVAVQLVGKTYGEVAAVAEKADVALLDQRLIVTGFDTTPCRVEIAPKIQRDPDGGAFLYALATYTYTAAKE